MYAQKHALNITKESKSTLSSKSNDTEELEPILHPKIKDKIRIFIFTRPEIPKKIYVEINTEDANQARVKEGDKIFVQSRRGSLIANALLTSNINKGQLFISMHYEEINQLTYASFDPYSRQPSFKYSAVKILKL